MEIEKLKHDLFLEEFKDLKQSHTVYMKELESTERLVILAVGALVSWIEAILFQSRPFLESLMQIRINSFSSAHFSSLRKPGFICGAER